jgi:hypothetical protein
VSNEDRRIRRNELRAALRASAALRAELVELRERNVHAVDWRAIQEATAGDYALCIELSGTGGGHPTDPDYLTRTD